VSKKKNKKMLSTTNVRRVCATAQAEPADQVFQQIARAEDECKRRVQEEFKAQKRLQEEFERRKEQTRKDTVQYVRYHYPNKRYTYDGQMLNCQFHGQGLLTYDDDQSTLRATWKYGELSGACVQTRRGVYTTQCNYVADKKHGVEKHDTHGQTRYTTFEHGVPVGCQRTVFSNGDVFLKNFSAGGSLESEDKGIYKCHDGTVYKGMKPETTRNMWREIHSTWNVFENVVDTMLGDTCMGVVIMCVPSIACGVLFGSVAITATVVGIAATPVTLIVDASRRSRNDITSV
jgi:rubredoxin